MVSEAAPAAARWWTDPRALGLRRDSPAAWPLLCGFAFSIPFSIFVAQLLLVLTSVAAAADWRARGLPRLRTPLDLPIAAFALSGLFGAFFGLDPKETLWGLRTYLQVVIIYLVYAYARSPDRALHLVRCYLAGSAVTAAYTMLMAVSPERFPRLFLGHMTQSGQLLFSIGLALPLLLQRAAGARWMPAALALYVFALIANLKRGVWLGVLTTVVTVGWLASRRLVLIAGLVIVTAVWVAPPVRARLAHSARDLFLPGNRYDIWLAAIDVIRRFPMGVGRKNGEILRDYANIPQHHKHAHNNALQITLENGFLGLAAFLWWMGTFAVVAWRTCRRIPPAAPLRFALAVAVFASFVGFHVAGLVEYNFGDSEVLEVFFLVMGLGLVMHEGVRHGE